MPVDLVTTLRLSAAEAGRPVVALFNQERIVVRAWPASENRIAVAELTYQDRADKPDRTRFVSCIAGSSARFRRRKPARKQPLPVIYTLAARYFGG